jgi:hypothetical protein
LYTKLCACGEEDIIKRDIKRIDITKYLIIEIGRRPMILIEKKIYLNIEFTYGSLNFKLQSFVRKEVNRCNTVIKDGDRWLLYNDARVDLYTPYSHENVFDLVQYALY